MKHFFIKCTVGELEPKNENCGHINPPLGGLPQGDLRGLLRGDSGDGPEHFYAKKFLAGFFSI